MTQNNTSTSSKRKKSAATGRKPRRKGGRRLHRGRVALVLSVLAIIVILIMVCVSRCSGGDGVHGCGDFRTPVPEAIEAGRADAVKVLKTAPQSMERDNALLFIRSRESELRSAGYGHAADDYINAANEYLNTHNILK